MINQITCDVCNCAFNNNETNTCQAPTVSVSMSINNSVCSSSQTMCSTFVPKNC